MSKSLPEFIEHLKQVEKSKVGRYSTMEEAYNTFKDISKEHPEIFRAVIKLQNTLIMDLIKDLEEIEDIRLITIAEATHQEYLEDVENDAASD